MLGNRNPTTPVRAKYRFSVDFGQLVLVLYQFCSSAQLFPSGPSC